MSAIALSSSEAMPPLFKADYFKKEVLKQSGCKSVRAHLQQAALGRDFFVQQMQVELLASHLGDPDETK